MKFNDIVNRITGISCPIFGISWNPPKSEIKIAKDTIIFLEAKRVLYVPTEMEVPSHCVNSVIEIRDFLTNQLMDIGNDKKLYEYVSAMRKSCNKFLNACSVDDTIIRYGGQWNSWASWQFSSALGEMRGLFGVMIMLISTTYGLDVEEGLASIIPE